MENHKISDEKIAELVSKAIEKHLAELDGDKKVADSEEIDPLKMPDAPLESVADSDEKEDDKEKEKISSSKLLWKTQKNAKPCKITQNLKIKNLCNIRLVPK